MKSLHGLLAVAVAAAVVPGCAGTKPVAEWRDPTLTQPLRHIAVGVATPDPARRRIVEDEIVSRLPPGAAVQSYTFIPEGSERDLNLVKKLIREQGCDGALVIRAGVSRSERVTAGAPVPVTAYGYWGYSYTTMYTPPTVEVETTVKVESRLYALEGERLVWSLTTETQNPNSPAQAKSEIADVLVQHLNDAKVLAAPAK
ncbi:MAG TPA: hypothetical protein VM683_06810 [Anaeromyxobacteraceae bacterium]|nr:hypothetical protein [Anaeromyxobacteraceae bacterium]